MWLTRKRSRLCWVGSLKLSDDGWQVEGEAEAEVSFVLFDCFCTNRLASFSQWEVPRRFRVGPTDSQSRISLRSVEGYSTQSRAHFEARETRGVAAFSQASRIKLPMPRRACPDGRRRRGFWRHLRGRAGSLRGRRTGRRRIAFYVCSSRRRRRSRTRRFRTSLRPNRFRPR